MKREGLILVAAVAFCAGWLVHRPRRAAIVDPVYVQGFHEIAVDPPPAKYTALRESYEKDAPRYWLGADEMSFVIERRGRFSPRVTVVVGLDWRQVGIAVGKGPIHYVDYTGRCDTTAGAGKGETDR